MYDFAYFNVKHLKFSFKTKFLQINWATNL